mmetsp:Transcript_32292/g.67712  ORF Transcript_32292/g.67712 Transcript_32292/m.67712 type:complete len:303 (-) Transcript_32292:1321-2229(-)
MEIIALAGCSSLSISQARFQVQPVFAPLHDTHRNLFASRAAAAAIVVISRRSTPHLTQFISRPRHHGHGAQHARHQKDQGGQAGYVAQQPKTADDFRGKRADDVSHHGRCRVGIAPGFTRGCTDVAVVEGIAVGDVGIDVVVRGEGPRDEDGREHDVADAERLRGPRVVVTKDDFQQTRLPQVRQRRDDASGRRRRIGEAGAGHRLHDAHGRFHGGGGGIRHRSEGEDGVEQGEADERQRHRADRFPRRGGGRRRRPVRAARRRWGRRREEKRGERTGHGRRQRDVHSVLEGPEIQLRNSQG